MLRRIALVICLLFIIETAAFSDTVQLKDGTVMEGVIVEETEDSIKLRVLIGVLTLSKSDVECIQQGTAEESKESIKQWNERKRQLKEEANEARQKKKTKTTVKAKSVNQ